MNQLHHLVLGLACSAASLAAQSAAQPPAEAHDLSEIRAAMTESGNAWRQFLTRRSMTSGVYQLAKGATDKQSPHNQDEVYYVLSGRATLEVSGKTFAAKPGALLFVAAGAPHRFVDIEEDLSTLVFFSTDQPTQGGMAAGPRPTEQTPYDEGSGRGSARVFYWFGNSSAGQLDINFGRPAWQPTYERFLTQPSGKRWRFGENFWTTLDTNIPLEIGGVALDVGQHYLVLEHSKSDGLRMIALDPSEVRQRKLDAYEAGKTTGGTPIPLSREDAPSAPRLAINMTVDRAEKNHATLRIRFGPHQLTAPIVMKPD